MHAGERKPQFDKDDESNPVASKTYHKKKTNRHGRRISKLDSKSPEMQRRNQKST